MCEKCDWETWLETGAELLSAAPWASDTIEGIMDWVASNDHITEKQIIALENIQAKAEER